MQRFLDLAWLVHKENLQVPVCDVRWDKDKDVCNAAKRQLNRVTVTMRLLAEVARAPAHRDGRGAQAGTPTAATGNCKLSDYLIGIGV